MGIPVAIFARYKDAENSCLACHEDLAMFNLRHGTDLRMISPPIAMALSSLYRRGHVDLFRDVDIFPSDVYVAYHPLAQPLGERAVYQWRADVPEVVLPLGKGVSSGKEFISVTGVSLSDFAPMPSLTRPGGRDFILGVSRDRLVVHDMPLEDGFYRPHVVTGLPSGAKVPPSDDAIQFHTSGLPIPWVGPIHFHGANIPDHISILLWPTISLFLVAVVPDKDLSRLGKSPAVETMAVRLPPTL